MLGAYAVSIAQLHCYSGIGLNDAQTDRQTNRQTYRVVKIDTNMTLSYAREKTAKNE
jgi:hypothetical protein